ncbi:MAG: hypothetical protein R3E32_09165 [Chitinophagales bacterium]
MNTRILFSLFFALLLALTSCSKDAEIVTELDNEILNHAKTSVCDLEDADVEIVPVCSFDPINFPEIPFPVYVYINGDRIPFQGYSYEWGTGSHGSAISVTYNQLPVSLLLTEDATDCQIALTLNQSFWGKESDITVVPVNNNHLPTSIALPEDSNEGGTDTALNQEF